MGSPFHGEAAISPPHAMPDSVASARYNITLFATIMLLTHPAIAQKDSEEEHF